MGLFNRGATGNITVVALMSQHASEQHPSSCRFGTQVRYGLLATVSTTLCLVPVVQIITWYLHTYLGLGSTSSI